MFEKHVWEACREEIKVKKYIDILRHEWYYNIRDVKPSPSDFEPTIFHSFLGNVFMHFLFLSQISWRDFLIWILLWLVYILFCQVHYILVRLYFIFIWLYFIFIQLHLIMIHLHLVSIQLHPNFNSFTFRFDPVTLIIVQIEGKSDGKSRYFENPIMVIF